MASAFLGRKKKSVASAFRDRKNQAWPPTKVGVGLRQWAALSSCCRNVAATTAVAKKLLPDGAQSSRQSGTTGHLDAGDPTAATNLLGKGGWQPTAGSPQTD